jgi:hypothetical protein
MLNTRRVNTHPLVIREAADGAQAHGTDVADRPFLHLDKQ